MNSFASCRSGSALVIILPIIALLALIILSVLSIALFDSRLASNSFGQTQAESMAKYAIDDVANELFQIPLDRHWASGPGRIRYWDGVSSWDEIDLHSGAPAVQPTAASSYLDGPTAANAAQCVQLNVPLEDGSYSIMSTNSEYPTAPDMTVNWIYVLQNGTIQTNVALLPSSGVIGRYAYWTDVENGRVNINTAGFGMVNGPPTPGNSSNPTGRFQWAVEGWTNLWNNPTASSFTSAATLANYAQWVLTPNPWISDQMQTNSSGVSFPALDRPTAQKNTIQNLTAHPSSIDLSFLDNVSVTQSFNTFRYAGSYFLRVDARNSYAYVNGTSGAGTNAAISPTPNPDTTVRFFNDPSDWQVIVDSATYLRNKGYITVRGRSPEINPWGLPKIALSMAAKDGAALNDLTEYYYRNRDTSDNVALGMFQTEDSRLTQVPEVVPPIPANEFSATVIPPYPLSSIRSSFRDMPNVYYGYNNYLFVSNLINDLKNVLNTSCPGFSTSLGAKYNAYGTSGGEAEQVAEELMSYVDCCLNCITPGFEHVNTQTGWGQGSPELSPYGLTLPMAATESTRREGTSGQFLLNEVAVQATPVAYANVYDGDASDNYVCALKPSAPPSVATTLPTPKGMLSQYHGSPVLLFLLRQPQDASPPKTNTSSDMFIKLVMRAEAFTPPHLGFSQPLTYISPYLGGTNSVNPEGGFENTDVQWSTNDTAWNTLHYDVYGDQKVNGVYTHNPDTPPTYISDNPTLTNSWYFPHWGAYEGVQSFSGSACPKINYPTPGDSYVEMTRNSFSGIYIGPFSPGTVVSLKLKSRLFFEFIVSSNSPTIAWEVLPGIFPDFVDGMPVTTVPATTPVASYTNNAASGNPDPNDPNAASITTNWLEYDFTDINVNSPVAQIVSYEAKDPRVTRHSSDWQLCTNSAGNTLGAVNSMYTSGMPDDSDLARPPSFLQMVRGPVRTETSLGEPEYQTASRILGLPGVGYLSSVPTGVDSGIPWSTMKFNVNAINETTPDWLLWNLFYVPFDRSMSNETDGKLNINAKLYPFKDASGNDLVREKPLEALLGNRVSSSNLTTLAQAIAAGPTYTNGGNLPSDLYVYTGQICQIPGLADSSAGTDEYDEERLPRDLADIITTQSSDFRVFAVAQSLKQSSTGQITPVATQRIEATLSRNVDAGRQGYAFGMLDSVSPGGAAQNGNGSGSPFYVYLRSAYRPTTNGAPVTSATRTEVEQSHAQGYSPLGLDHTPNTPDDWLIPQKITISSYKIIK